MRWMVAPGDLRIVLGEGQAIDPTPFFIGGEVQVEFPALVQLVA